jgi:hypothetical protein
MLAFGNLTTQENAGVNGNGQGLENMVLRADRNIVVGSRFPAQCSRVAFVALASSIGHL